MQVLGKLAGILATPVRMADQYGRRPTLLIGHVQRIANQLGWHAWCHGPAHHFARVQVQHGCQMLPAGTGTDIRDVADVRQVRRARLALPVQHVASHWQVVLAVRRMDELALPDRLQNLRAHQTNCAPCSARCRTLRWLCTKPV